MEYVVRPANEEEKKLIWLEYKEENAMVAYIDPVDQSIWNYVIRQVENGLKEIGTFRINGHLTIPIKVIDNNSKLVYIKKEV